MQISVKSHLKIKSYNILAEQKSLAWRTRSNEMTPVKKTYSGIELLCFYATFRHSDLTFSYVVTNITQKYVWAIFWQVFKDLEMKYLSGLNSFCTAICQHYLLTFYNWNDYKSTNKINTYVLSLLKNIKKKIVLEL